MFRLFEHDLETVEVQWNTQAHTHTQAQPPMHRSQMAYENP